MDPRVFWKNAFTSEFDWFAPSMPHWFESWFLQHITPVLSLQGGRHVDYVSEQCVAKLIEIIKKKNKEGIKIMPFQVRFAFLGMSGFKIKKRHYKPPSLNWLKTKNDTSEREKIGTVDFRTLNCFGVCLMGVVVVLLMIADTLRWQGMTVTFFPTCPVGQVDEFSTCPSGKTSCPCQVLKINHFD